MGQATEGRGGGVWAKVAGWALKGAAGAALLGALVAPAQAQYTKVVVFSDSMSDTYRYYEFTRKTLGKGYPLSPPAMQGRFCDGPVAVEVLARELKVPLENYSFSGAQTGYGTLFPGVMLGVLTQVNEYVSFPTMSFLRDEVDKAVARGINVKDACHPGGLNLTQFEDRPVCPDPQNYLFWDDNHPTAAANEILGVAWSKAIVYRP